MTSSASSISTPAPAHVPGHLVHPFDYYNAPELKHEPHARMRDFVVSRPPLFYTVKNGGHWVVGRSALALDMLRQTDKFSSDPRYNSAARVPRTVPQQYDPPDVMEYRRILSPFFSPVAMRVLEPAIRAQARALIAAVLPRGRCEFLHEIAEEFPVIVFLQMTGSPLSDRHHLVGLADKAVRDPDRAVRERVVLDLADYVKAALADRRRHPGSDMLSHIVQAQFNGRPLTEEELVGMGVLLFLAGLDTVAAALSFIVLYLARHPADYARIAAAPERIPATMEELLRVHGVAGMERGVTHDLDYEGVRMARGDRILFVPQLYGFDQPGLDRPMEVDFTREQSPHLIFGAGPHRCIGSHLARTELRVFMEEWSQAVPSFADQARRGYRDARRQCVVAGDTAARLAGSVMKGWRR